MGGVYRIQTFFGFLYIFYIYKALDAYWLDHKSHPLEDNSISFQLYQCSTRVTVLYKVIFISASIRLSSKTIVVSHKAECECVPSIAWLTHTKLMFSCLLSY